MEIIEKGFVVKYEVFQVGFIKPGGAGEFSGRPYSASLKFRASNLFRDENEEFGLVDKEELVEFRIPCESNIQVSELNKLFRNLKDNGVVINLDGNLPNKNENSEFLKVTVLNTPQQLMEKYHSLMTPIAKENKENIENKKPDTPAK